MIEFGGNSTTFFNRKGVYFHHDVPGTVTVPHDDSLVEQVVDEIAREYPDTAMIIVPTSAPDPGYEKIVINDQEA